MTGKAACFRTRRVTSKTALKCAFFRQIPKFERGITTVKLSIEKKILESIIATACGFVNSRSPDPSLQHILLEAKASLTVTAHDLEAGISATVDADIEEPGSLTCPAQLLKEIVSKLPRGVVTMESLSEGRMRVKSGKSRFEVATLPADEYRAFPSVDYSETTTIPLEVMADAVGRVAVAAASAMDESRAVMTGIRVKLDAESLTMVTTDGRRLACVRRDVVGSTDMDFIMIARAAREISKLAKTGEVHISATSGQAVFSVGSTRIYCRLIDGRFPDHTKVIPTQFQRVARIGKEDLIGAIKRMLIVAQEKRSPNLIRFEFSDGLLTLRSNTPDIGSGEEQIPIVYDGEPLTIGFNGSYFLDGLNVIPDEEVVLNLQDEIKSAVLTPVGDNDSRYVMMPVKLRDVAVDEVAA